MADSDRFFTDFAAAARQQRQLAHQAKENDLARRREEALRAEQARAMREEQEGKAFEEQTARLQADGRAAQKNRAGAAFDPLTHNYASGPDGERLRSADDGIKYRAASRASYLAEHSTGAGYNLVTGAQEAPTRHVAHLAAGLGVPVPAPQGFAFSGSPRAHAYGQQQEFQPLGSGGLVSASIRPHAMSRR